MPSKNEIINIAFHLLINSEIYGLKYKQIIDDYLFFDEKIFPSKELPEFFSFFKKNPYIQSIQRNIFDGNRNCTYLLIYNVNKEISKRLIHDFLIRKNLIFDSSKYPLDNTIMIKEDIELKNKIDFEIIVNVIKSLKSIEIVNIERNKLYLYMNNHIDNLFQKSSFICFRNKFDKMVALNHINKIIFEGKENILKYNINLHYATIDDTVFIEKVRILIPSIFQCSKGFRDYQQHVLSIESPIPRTYVGFDSIANLKNCYCKFFLKLNAKLNNEKIDVSSFDDFPCKNNFVDFEEECLYNRYF